MGSRCLFVTLVNGNRREPSPPARTIPFIVVILRYKSLLVYHRSPVPSQSFECVIGSGSPIHAAANSSEAVENLIRVNSWNSWRIYWPRIPRISRKRSPPFGCHWFEIQFFTVSPAALFEFHF